MNIKQNKQILKEIIEHDAIIIHRHKSPDGDAIGSQYGLYLTLRHNYPNKEICVVGDVNNRCFGATMDEITDDKYDGALVFVLDTAVTQLISDDRYTKGDKLIIIDHHTNDTNVDKVDIYYKNPDYSSASGMVTDLIKSWKLDVPKEAATFLFLGIVTDTGRFMHLKEGNAESTFNSAAFLSKFNPDVQNIYNYLYVETLESKRTREMFAQFEVTPNFVAYRKNTREVIEKSGLDFFSVSRGMVNQMAGIEEIKIWVSFSENEEGKIIVEIRSRGILVVDIAREFGGGGHNEACGATLNSFEEADLMLKRLDERAKENEHDK